MMKWYIISILMTIVVLGISLWVTNKAYSRKWENDEPENDPFDFDQDADSITLKRAAQPQADNDNPEKA